MSPSASRWHQSLAGMLISRLSSARANGYTINQAVDVQLSEQTTGIPDVLIVRAGVSSERRLYLADDLAAAIEIESPTSGANDRRLKPIPYADYKIPYYWRIELEPELIAVVHRLEDGAYVEVSRGPRIDVTEPFPFSVDLADLIDPDA
ncbi:hypothetical protein GCM10020369_20770 [Cryptosporangium minutisporangium]|uniref:Putative restriction endonuclease domain-containing protein n=1 Tax=Cryptosporangium minutisporangium TaxID=113569 RepID=A0ABP6SWF6_9ACTN